jgi:Ca-activated chloride channel family protein
MRRLSLVLLVGWLSWAPGATAATQQPRPTFKTGTDLVAVTVVATRPSGQPITDLKRGDFQLLDNGHQRAILDFESDATPVSLGLLVDLSGSMDVAERRSATREVIGHILSWLTPTTDRVGLFGFDTRLQELEPMGPAPGSVLERLDTVRPYGSTSLYDAIAETGRRLATAGRTRHAVVALTDGADNSSRLSPAEVSAVASAIDVPIYIFVVVSPLDRSGQTTFDEGALTAVLNGRLGDLARWTGGAIFAATGPAQTSIAARQIVTELRHQYLIGFEPDTQPGWHTIEVRALQKDVIVRARSGYIVPSRPNAFR